MFGHIYAYVHRAIRQQRWFANRSGKRHKKKTLSVAARTYSGTEIIARAESRHKNDNEGSQMRRVIRLERRTPFNLALMMVIAARPRRHTPRAPHRKPLLYMCSVWTDCEECRTHFHNWPPNCVGLRWRRFQCARRRTLNWKALASSTWHRNRARIIWDFPGRAEITSRFAPKWRDAFAFNLPSSPSHS